MRPTLGCDVDSTLWDTGARVRDVLLDITGDTLDPEVVSTWTQILDVYGERVTAEIFTSVLSPARVREREPYPGAPEALRHLQDERGVRIHFITRNPHPEAMASHLEPWLREHFGPGVGLTVTIGEKLCVLRELGAFGLVDDRPETLGRVADAGLWAAARIQPWNRALVAQRKDVHGFTDWREVPNLLPVL
jgi:5' nucleotidase, deoxy (Pyrimidine), cytosolic type C protein (NT5C)